MNEMASKLQEYLSVRRNNDIIIVKEFRNIDFGSEAEKYSFDENSVVNKKPVVNKFVLRLHPGAYEAYGVKHEYTVMNRLYKEGFPVPRVILYEEDSSILGGLS